MSEKFKTSFREFVKSNLVNEIKRVRESLGLKNEGLTPKQIKLERTDPDTQKLLRNFTHITKSQF